MLKLGNSYIKFGNDFIHNWRPNEYPVMDNGWKELYTIDPNTFVANTLAGPQLMGENSSYLATKEETPYSGYCTQFNWRGWYDDDVKFKNRKIYSNTFASDNPNYFLLHYQIAPHIILGNFEHIVRSYYYNDTISAKFGGINYVGSANIENALVSYFQNRMCEDSDYTIGISLNNIPFTMSAKASAFCQIATDRTYAPDLSGHFTRYFSEISDIRTTFCDEPLYCYEYNEVPHFSDWSDVTAAQSYIEPWNFNLLVKNEPNSNVKVSSYVGDFWTSPEYIGSAEYSTQGNTGAFSTLEFYTLSSKQIERNEWVTKNSASLPSLTLSWYNNGWKSEYTLEKNEIYNSFFLYRGFEVINFGVSGCYVQDPEANDMLNKLINRSYTDNAQ